MFALQDWYDLKGQPYMLGLLLHGQPGTGKVRVLSTSTPARCDALTRPFVVFRHPRLKPSLT